MSAKVMLSQERVEDSSDGESTNSDEGSPQKQKVNGLSHRNKTEPESRKEDLSQDSDSDSSNSSSQSSASTGSKRKFRSPTKDTSEPVTKKSKTSSGKIRRIEASKYAPPRGYTAIDSNTNGHATNQAKIFRDLKEKQIWHISAPENLSLSQIRSIDLSSVLQGGTLLEHKGTKYSMTAEEPEDAIILVPSSSNADYIPTKTKVTRSFFVREQPKKIDNSARHTTDSNVDDNTIATSEPSVPTFFATQLGTKRTPREQPANLKARYVPFGVPIKQQNSHQPSEGATNESAQQDLPSSPMSGVERTSSPVRVPPTKKTPKKKSKTISDDIPMAEASQPDTPSSISKTPKDKRKRDQGDKKTKDIPETSTPQKITKHDSSISGSVSSTPASTSKKKKVH